MTLFNPRPNTMQFIIYSRLRVTKILSHNYPTHYDNTEYAIHHLHLRYIKQRIIATAGSAVIV